MNFDSLGYISIYFLEIFTSKAHKLQSVYQVFEIFEIKAKLQLQGLDSMVDFLDKNSKIWP